MNSILFYVIEFFIAVIIVLLYYKFIETKGIKRFTKFAVGNSVHEPICDWCWACNG